MSDAAGLRPHTFHVPVMGTGFMIDAPLRVARYGISSVISLVDDVLIEQMRRFHSQRVGEPYEAIGPRDDDARARRITAYLDLIGRLVARQVESLRASPFAPGSEITRYFELLPDVPLRQMYLAMLAATEPEERARLEAGLRQAAVPGKIDVNIMSKVDRDPSNGRPLPPGSSDALAALRGFARSRLASSVVFSAGMNPRLYGYAAEFDDFFPGPDGEPRKKIILKVSDFHSAAVQGRFLAKRGLWVSEFRIESGLNCGGHAFATQGLLLGPILEEFREKKDELTEQLHAAYVKALGERGRPRPAEPAAIRITVQGGIGTAEEDRLLREHYGVDGTGWGTPFLLVPEVTHVDDEHLRLLCEATEREVYLSRSSPFGVPLWNLRTSASEEARRRRIAADRPGSACSKGFVKLSNTEFTERPICTASREYQKQKLEQLAAAELPVPERTARRDDVLAKSCICHDLAGGVARRTGIDGEATPAVCCGPNIVNFSRAATLEEMVGHIYGRTSLLTRDDRPHMFLREFALYLDFFREERERQEVGLAASTPAYSQGFLENLLRGVEHYRVLAGRFIDGRRDQFLGELDEFEGQVRGLMTPAG